MKKFGSKDVMRMESIKEKSYGDYMRQLTYAYNMATAITEPGKAMARGYAAQEVFGEQSAVGQVFFERAYDLSGGREVRPNASVNPLDTSEEGIEAEYSTIPLGEQPASRQSEYLKSTLSQHAPGVNLAPAGKVNVIKGTGPQFNLYEYPQGTIEVWQTEGGRYRLTYTSHYEPIYGIGVRRKFKFDGKEETWDMVDYIDATHMANLAPIYGKSIPIYYYD